MASKFKISDRLFDLYEDPDFLGWEPNISDNVAKKKLILFLEKYASQYSKEDLKFIMNNYMNGIGLKCIDVRISQLFSALEIYPRQYDPYYGFLNLLKKYFKLNCNILDVASGCYPTWGRIVAFEQVKLDSGTITLIDPKIVIPTNITSNMKIYKEFFTKDTKIEKFDFVTSILPYTLTDTLLKKILYENKNFFVALSNSFTAKDIEYNHERIIENTNNFIEKHNIGTLNVERLGNNYHNNLPVLIYKKIN